MASPTPEITERADRPFLIPQDRLTPEQNAIVARIESGPRKRVPINQRIWLENPAFADVAERFGNYVSQLAPIPARQKEICICVVAAFWQSQYEWYWHERLAQQHGVTQEQTDAIWRGEETKFVDDAEQATYELARALTSTRKVSDDLYRRSLQTLGKSGVHDRIGLMGLYTMIAQTLMFYDAPMPAA
jgi:4-carboxymuconolactone decarboxylase